MAYLFKEIGARTSILWGIALASLMVLLVDNFIHPLNIPAAYNWVPSVAAITTWSILFIGAVAKVLSWFSGLLQADKKEKLRKKYAQKNLLCATIEEKKFLFLCKQSGIKRIPAPRGTCLLKEMVRQGMLQSDSLDVMSDTRHYIIPDDVWNFLDNIPEGWQDEADANTGHLNFNNRI